jgi:acyl-CoA reductase-like NAD-dependent aldehyde dehydrogenase
VQQLIHDLPFGGVGNSGMGKYHGEWGFRAYRNIHHQHLREVNRPKITSIFHRTALQDVFIS